MGLEQNECYIKDQTKFTQEYRDQLLAEAIELYNSGYDIFEWTEEQLSWWERSNESNLAENDFIGRISSYLEMKRPKSWYSMSVEPDEILHAKNMILIRMKMAMSCMRRRFRNSNKSMCS